MEADAPEPKSKKPRADESVEPIFVHSVSTSFCKALSVAGAGVAGDAAKPCMLPAQLVQGKAATRTNHVATRC